MPTSSKHSKAFQIVRQTGSKSFQASSQLANRTQLDARTFRTPKIEPARQISRALDANWLGKHAKEASAFDLNEALQRSTAGWPKLMIKAKSSELSDECLSN